MVISVRVTVVSALNWRMSILSCLMGKHSSKKVGFVHLQVIIHPRGLDV